MYPRTRGSLSPQKGWVRKSQIRKVLHLRKVRNLTIVYVRKCAILQTFIDRLPTFD
jgi:hypothetical protein